MAMGKHFAFAFATVTFQVVWFVLNGLRAGATEHERMFNEYVPTAYDRGLEAGSYVFFAPAALMKWIFPEILARGDLSGFLVWNLSISAIVALLLSMLFHKLKNRKQSVSE